MKFYFYSFLSALIIHLSVLAFFMPQPISKKVNSPVHSIGMKFAYISLVQNKTVKRVVTPSTIRTNKSLPSEVNTQHTVLNSTEDIQGLATTTNKSETSSGSISTNQSGSTGTINAIFSRYFVTVRDIVASELHEEQAHRLKRRGELVIRITIQKKGEIIDVQLEQTSGNSKLDLYALKVIREIHTLPPIPQEIGDEKIIFRIPILFRAI